MRQAGYRQEIAAKSVMFALLLILVELGPSDVLSAPDRRQFRVHGYVQWIAGEKLMLQADSGGIMAIDLTEADQSAYQALAQGEGITVGGVVKPPESVDDRFVPFLALWIQRDRQ
jgi:hypothetical protein